MLRQTLPRGSEDSLAIRAAWLHYIGGLTQAEVGARLGVPGVKAHRLIARAMQAGAVKVTIVGDIVDCAVLEDTLCTRYALSFCDVAPDLAEGAVPLRALGAIGAAFLRREIDSLQDGIIGIGNGRTLARVVSDMPPGGAPGIRFVSLLGGLTRNYAANPFDVMHRLAEKTSAVSYTMPAPFFANSAEDRTVILAQRGVQEVQGLAYEAALLLVGIGGARSDANLVTSGVIMPEDMGDVIARGGVGEMLGHFFDASGRPVETSLGGRLLSARLETLRERRIVAIAGGDDKIEAIRAILRSGLLSGLITDERTAAVLAEDP
jgi:DNA-binding transcriptional regulator LsrR (DeoR family)